MHVKVPCSLVGARNVATHLIPPPPVWCAQTSGAWREGQLHFRKAYALLFLWLDCISLQQSDTTVAVRYNSQHRLGCWGHG